MVKVRKPEAKVNVLQRNGRAKAAKSSRFHDFAAVIERVGNVPPNRIYTYPAPGTATEADLLDSSIVGDLAVELVDGILVEKTMGFREDYVGTNIAHFLLKFLDDDNLGAVAGPAGMIRFRPGLVRIPDVTFIRWDSVEDTDDIEDPDGAFLEHAPDLAVEVLSPNNTRSEMDIKLDEYAKAGVKLVWYVDPEEKTVLVFPDARYASRKRLGLDGILDGGAVLPGFKLPVKDIFARRAPKKIRKNGK